MQPNSITSDNSLTQVLRTLCDYKMRKKNNEEPSAFLLLCNVFKGICKTPGSSKCRFSRSVIQYERSLKDKIGNC